MNMRMSLEKASVGDKVLLCDFTSSESVYFKFISLGILPGDTLTIMGKAPFGGPISVKHGSQTFFALRKKEAVDIYIDKIGNSCDTEI